METTGYVRILRLREELGWLRLPNDPACAEYECIWLRRMGIHATIAAIMHDTDGGGWTR